MKMISVHTDTPPPGFKVLVKLALDRNDFRVAHFARNDHLKNEHLPSSLCFWDSDGRALGQVTHWFNPRLLDRE